MNSSPNTNKHPVAGEFMQLDGESWYRISAYDRMPPFLMNIASDTDLWMFISSAGGLTAGRVDADGSIFPYETTDKLHDGHHHTGPVTVIRAAADCGSAQLWQPFLGRCGGQFRVERNLYKNVTGNRVMFEEINHDLALAFRYRWTGCDEFGIVRTVSLLNRGSSTAALSILDGVRNVLPFGAPLALHQQLSCLIDAYKRCDVDPGTGLGMFSLTARIIDRPEAAEELRTNVVWCCGLKQYDVCLSIETVQKFLQGCEIKGETLLTGRRGNYFVHTSRNLEPGAVARWHIAADAGRSHSQVAELRAHLLQTGDLDREIERGLQNASDELLRSIGSADGLQLTAQSETHAHHTANVLFNNMRGGVFSDNYLVPADDFRDFLTTRNTVTAKRQAVFLESLPAEMPMSGLRAAADATGDADLRRLSREYLPIYFGRRHGDPSRPWNRFSIELKQGDGSRALRHEGNWRDIFQNWEALSLSFPDSLQHMISKFVNASTIDGFNPYRITRDGIDWEIIDPDDPWSFIGYWGDHQIVYLLKFLEALERYSPGTLGSLLVEGIFCYANVPYRLKSYNEILQNPHATIRYDSKLAARIDERVRTTGTDGKLLAAADGSLYHVTLMEKLLVPALSKLSNFVPGGGIWMNTQRPEWNDANNALAGNGISMVTLCYLRRYLAFIEKLLSTHGESDFTFSSEVAAWFKRITGILAGNLPHIEPGPPRDEDRKQFLDDVGHAFEQYRDAVYSGGFSGTETLTTADISGFCRTALTYLDRAITENRREDGLYHSYNLLELPNGGNAAAVHHLYEMLEGQVAVLSSGVLDAAESIQLLTALFESNLFRKDQRSFLLYPARELPSFLEKNAVPEQRVQDISLLKKLLELKDHSILERDAAGVYRFNADFSNRNDLESALDRLADQSTLRDAVLSDRPAVLDLFEEIFHHKSFTGRSGTMYGYEGLGSIYWHMVAKLLVAVQETALRFTPDPKAQSDFKQLARLYYRIRSGLGFEKSPAEYGAFPTDPYSHTPAHAGARQPGMTGQVKEEIITRFGELGVQVSGGTVSFGPSLLKRSEFLAEPATYQFYDIRGRQQSFDLPEGTLGFTFCQVPVVYELSAGESWISITGPEGAFERFPGDRLDAERSRALFERRGEITRIDVGVPEHLLLNA